jgi:nanoRNase/pAp phosphatase (c-di-AMP/oligoRNAs hydrolase)
MSPAAERGGAGKLLSVRAPARRLLILTHANPDPDALASALGLQTLLRRRLERSAVIVFSGIIGRPENRAMVEQLEIGAIPIEQAEAGPDSAFILVDTQPGRRNNALPAGTRPIAVIDHHPDWGGLQGVAFVDLREDYGATSTIVTEYLRELDLRPSSRLATALFYGIASETRHLARETETADIACSQYLYRYVDKRTLGAIETPALERSYFELIDRAVQSALCCDAVVIALLDEVPYPDAVAEMADFLVRLRSARWAVCIAPHDGWIYVSLRSSDPEARAGLLLASVLPSGTAGGHGMTAGGRVPLSENGNRLVCDVAAALLAKLGSGGGRPRWLLERTGRRAGTAASRLRHALSLEKAEP